MVFKPVASRIEVVDALRGFALLGIVIANVPYPFVQGPELGSRQMVIGTLTVNDFLQIVLYLFVNTKFLAIFSMLFGFGFYIQLSRARAKGVRFNAYFLRRMFLLLVIGCIHAYLIWYGDIIRDYAICGMILLLFSNWSDKKVLHMGILMCVLGTGAVYILNGVFEMNSNYNYDPAIAHTLEYNTSYLAYLEANFTIDPFVNFLHDSPLTLIFAFGCMLIGFWLGKIGIFSHTEKHGRLMKKWIWVGCTAGINASLIFWMVTTGRVELNMPIIWLVFLIIVGMMMQSLAYIALFIKGYSLPRVNKFLRLFIPVGRMALSNYILQSVFYTIVMFHWFPGLRLFGKLTLAETYFVAVAIFAVQTLLSHLWMKRYAQGPIEYIWRRLSYRNVREVSEKPLSTVVQVS